MYVTCKEYNVYYTLWVYYILQVMSVMYFTHKEYTVYYK